MNGRTPVVSFAVYRAKGASEVTVADAVHKRLDALAAAHPEVGYTLIDDGVRASRGSYLSAMHGLLEGAVLATIVVLLFLRNCAPRRWWPWHCRLACCRPSRLCNCWASRSIS